MRFYLPFLATILMLLTSCTPPKDYLNVLVRSMPNDLPVKVNIAKVGELVEVTIKARAGYLLDGTVAEKTSSVTIGAVLQLDEKLSCPALPQTILPSGVVLESGSSLNKQFDLVVKKWQVVDFSHTLRFTSTSARKVAVLVGMWGKPTNRLGTGDLESEPVGLLDCKPIDLNNVGVGALPQIVTFQ